MNTETSSIADLRSDTLTKPTADMRDAMAGAEVGNGSTLGKKREFGSWCTRGCTNSGGFVCAMKEVATLTRRFSLSDAS